MLKNSHGIITFNTDIIMEKNDVKVNECYNLRQNQINLCRVIALKEISENIFVIYENIDSNTYDIISIDEFNKMRLEAINSDEFDLDKELRKVNPVRALTSGMITKDYIDRKVYITNSEADVKEWVIADVNHDGTKGTVDLFPVEVLKTDMQFDPVSQLYGISDLRSWLNGKFYNGFSDEVRDAITYQQTLSNGEILLDKVKCPSLTELGINCNRYLIKEGSIYPIFGNKTKCDANELSIFKDKNKNSTRYWTRSRNTNYSTGVWGVYYNGYCNATGYYCNSYAVVACIRFKKS